MFTVYLFDKIIGTVERRGRGVRFTYSESALDDPDLPALSISLPKRPEHYTDRRAGPFFRNLLPEQSYRRLVAGAANTPLRDSIALLGAIGGECPGAVSIWPADQEPPVSAEYDPIDASGFRTLFAPDKKTLGSAIARGRLSLPGVQEKIALFRDADGQWFLPKNGAITTHILKLPNAAYPGLLENELFCTLLAAEVNLPVSTAGVVDNDVRVLWTDRFDRIPGAGPPRMVRKLHQEDFCQALGHEPSRKYQADGGPSLRQCAQLVTEYSSLPADDLPRLVDWTAFNFIIGNEDAHAKNIAFLYGRDGLRLSPHYDLVSTEIYPELERVMAMKIGRAWDIRNVQRSDWKLLASQLQVPWDLARSRVLRVADLAQGLAAPLVTRCRDQFGDDPVYAQLTDLIARRSELVRHRLSE